MTRNSESSELVGVMPSGDLGRRKLPPAQFRLRLGASILALLNLVALYFYVFPPGGTRQDLEQESTQVHTQIRAEQTQAAKSRGLAAHVQTASEQASAFSGKYFLPRRTAYVTVLEEIQRLAKASGIQERDAALSEEPIEGTADLTLLNITASYEGTNTDLMKFLNEADRSPMLLILDMLQTSPQQRNSQLNTSIRFQAIVREPAATTKIVAASVEGQQP
jgi:hypothetical protein